MITVRWQHVVLAAASFSGHRIARVLSRAGASYPVAASGTYADAGFSWVSRVGQGAALDSYQHEILAYIFAFWSVSYRSVAGVEGVPGGLVSPDRQQVGVTIASSPNTMWIADATAWYVWDFGGGPGEIGIYLDAFDVANGFFLPDDFVTASPDSSITSGANDGLIPTSGPDNRINSDQIITADPTLEAFVTRDFQFWLAIDLLTFPAAGDPGSPELSKDRSGVLVHPIPEGVILVAFAIYGLRALAADLSVTAIQAQHAILGMTDGGLWVVPRGPVPPAPGPEPFNVDRALAAAAALSTAAGFVIGPTQAKLRKSASAIAESAAQALHDLAGIPTRQPPFP